MHNGLNFESVRTSRSALSFHSLNKKVTAIVPTAEIPIVM